MNTRRFVCCLFLAFMALGVSNAQDKLSKDEWQQQMQDYTKQRDDLKQQLGALNKDIDDLRQQLASLDHQIQLSKDETMAMVGATEEMRRAFEQKLSVLESNVENLARMSDSDLLAHKEDVDKAQTRKDEMMKQKISALADFHRRLQTIQDKLNSLKSTIGQQAIAANHEKYYIVKTWAKNRDCLWNIAKKPSVYDNAFLWTKIYEGNKDQIKDPNLIYPNQRLVIPPAGSMASKSDTHRSKTMAHRRTK